MVGAYIELMLQKSTRIRRRQQESEQTPLAAWQRKAASNAHFRGRYFVSPRNAGGK
ncbi:MAG TPA: hypothetical protein VNF00_06455 [Candidatus Acidoferrales bacterium]|nr:hypothetical protein [Candidatus Acidoferrales bacterium]